MRYFWIAAFTILSIMAIHMFSTVLLKNKQTPSRKIKRDLDKILSAMQKDYLNFIDNKINIEIIKNDNIYIDKEKLVHESIKILRPYIDALWAFVNSNYTTEHIELKGEANLFSTLAFILEKSIKHNGELPDNEYIKLEKAVVSMLEADITKRMIMLGNA